MPQWGELDFRPEPKELKEDEPFWEGYSSAQLESRGEEHLEKKMGMQDSVEVIEGFRGRKDALWAGVYDGHYFPKEIGRAEAPNKLVLEMLAKEFTKAVDSGENYEEAFKKSFSAVHEKIRQDSAGGSTASTVLIEGNEVWVANVGDSYVFKFNQDHEPECLTADHNVNSNILARREAAARGGYYFEGYIHNVDWRGRSKDVGNEEARWFEEESGLRVPGLMLSRSLGDPNMEGVISSEPEVNRFEIMPSDKWILLGSDGFWELLSINDIHYILKNSRNAAEAQDRLIKSIKNVEGGNPDDVSLTVIKLKK